MIPADSRLQVVEVDAEGRDVLSVSRLVRIASLQDLHILTGQMGNWCSSDGGSSLRYTFHDKGLSRTARCSR